MVNKRGNTCCDAVPRCSITCLGPLTFDPRAVGEKVRLSEGGRLAERTAHTFKNGLVFSSRPVRLQERILLRVERDTFAWHGALRVGFTSVPPSARSLPLPRMAVPDLTSRPGHWAAPVHESFCVAGSELEFWVSRGGTVYVKSAGVQGKLLEGVDLSRPLWAMIDIYGQTRSIYLLGSKQIGLLYTRRSCPAPKRLSSPDINSLIPDVSSIVTNNHQRVSLVDAEVSADDRCVVCLEREATITLPCAHRCLCSSCGSRVMEQFNTCPLCRHRFTECL